MTKQSSGHTLVTTQVVKGERSMASFKEGEPRSSDAIPALDDLQPGKPCGAVLTMSAAARTQFRERIEVIEYLLNREQIVCN